MTPAEFHKKYQGWGRDVDGVAGMQWSRNGARKTNTKKSQASRTMIRNPKKQANGYWITITRSAVKRSVTGSRS